MIFLGKRATFFTCTFVFFMSLFSWVDLCRGKDLFKLSSTLPIQVDELKGVMEIIKPGGMIKVYKTGRVPRSIPSGSKIKCVKGFIYASIGKTKLRIKQDGACWVWKDKKTGTVYIIIDKKSKGIVEILIEDSLMKPSPGANIKIEIDEVTQMAKLTIIKGTAKVKYKGTIKELSQGEVMVVMLGVEEKVEFIAAPDLETIEEASPYIP